MTEQICKLALEDGTLFTGRAIGAAGTRAGEVVFNTAMTGYQEVFTDPSYCGQIVTMTFPLQGNYGVNAEDFEAAAPVLSGVVLRTLAPQPRNFRATMPLDDFLRKHDVVGIAEIDTRALTRRLRQHGALRGVLSTEISGDLALVAQARAAAPMTGANLVRVVMPAAQRAWSEPLWHAQPEKPPAAAPEAGCHIAVLDCGVKHNILRHLADRGCRVTVVPGAVSADAVRALRPDGLLIGNGPGDPAAVGETVETLRRLLGEFPMLGICLGHQLLALALGARTYKLPFGHHGANMPVLNHLTGHVEITSQNHGFAVDVDSLEQAGGRVTHVNLNDGSLEGFVHADYRLSAVQFHPEASPGPHDAAAVFGDFVARVGEGE